MTYDVVRCCSLTGEMLITTHQSTLNFTDFERECRADSNPDQVVRVAYHTDFLYTHAELILRRRLLLIDAIHCNFTAKHTTTNPMNPAIAALDAIALRYDSEVMSIVEGILLVNIEFVNHTLHFTDSDDDLIRHPDRVYYTIIDNQHNAIYSARVYSQDHAAAIFAAVERLND